MSESKRSFTCAECGATVIGLVKEEGTVPHILSDCINTNCNGQMWNDFATLGALAGKPPTHHLARNPEAKTDKLELKKVVAND